MHPEHTAPTEAGYEDDLVEWALAQAAALRAGRWADVDVENLAEEIESLARSDKREVRSRLRVLIAHLLKKFIQPERATASWDTTIFRQALGIETVLRDSPSLRRQLPDFIANAFPSARKEASRETRLAIERFPSTIPPEIEAQLAAVLADAAEPS